MTNQETMKFDAEIGKVLKLMIHSLYTNKDIFLRELVSNASDACDKLRYLAQTDGSILGADNDLKIQVKLEKDHRSIAITDNGIGMSKQDLIENIGTIARSGTQNFASLLSQDQKDNLQLIGQFGVGFYSAFMIAEEVKIITRKYNEKQAYMWQSKGEGEYTITELEGDYPRGTSVILTIREGEDAYLDKYRITNIVETYSDHILFRVELLDEAGGEPKTINAGSALWTRNKSEISEEQYKEFYHHIAHSPDEPWMILHNKNEGLVEYTNLLYIPSMKPFDLFFPDRKCRVKLYVKRVFITEESVNLVPQYLRFMRGVVDSEDLPLNISRETLQNNNVIQKIRKSIVKRVISELKKKLDSDKQDYIKFWDNFGAVLKEGLCEAMESREGLLEVCLFRSAISGELITLDEYIANMKESQETIFYYQANDEFSKVKSSPQIEGFIKRGIDVLIFNDAVDDFWVNVEHEYKDKEMKSVTRSGIDLDKISKIEEEQKDEKVERMPSENDTEKLVQFFKDELSDVVSNVTISQKLLDSPACLTVAEGAMDIKMERFLLEQRQLAASTKKILEINLNHPINKRILEYIKTDETSSRAKDLVTLLYDQACIIEGEPLRDATSFSKRMNLFVKEAIEA